MGTTAGKGGGGAGPGPLREQAAACTRTTLAARQLTRPVGCPATSFPPDRGDGASAPWAPRTWAPRRHSREHPPRLRPHRPSGSQAGRSWPWLRAWMALPSRSGSHATRGRRGEDWGARPGGQRVRPTETMDKCASRDRTCSRGAGRAPPRAASRPPPRPCPASCSALDLGASSLRAQHGRPLLPKAAPTRSLSAHLRR